MTSFLCHRVRGDGCAQLQDHFAIFSVSESNIMNGTNEQSLSLFGEDDDVFLSSWNDIRDPLLALPPKLGSEQLSISSSFLLDPLAKPLSGTCVSSEPSDEASSIGGSSSLDEGKSKSKKERNRVSASKYRNKRKLHLESLEVKVQELSENVSQKESKIAALESENQLLKEQLGFLQQFLKNLSSNPKAAFAGVALALFGFFILTSPSFSLFPSQFEYSNPSITGHGRRLLHKMECSAMERTLFEVAKTYSDQCDRNLSARSSNNLVSVGIDVSTVPQECTAFGPLPELCFGYYSSYS